MIDLKTIQSTANLARLKVSEEEARGLAENFERILNYFNEIDGIDVEGVAPLFSPFDLETELRADVADSKVPVSEILESAPSLRDKEYLVPPVVS